MGGGVVFFPRCPLPRSRREGSLLSRSITRSYWYLKRQNLPAVANGSPAAEPVSRAGRVCNRRVIGLSPGQRAPPCPSAEHELTPSTIAVGLLTLLLLPWPGQALAAPGVTVSPLQDRQTLAAEKAQRHASSVRLRVPGGEDLGSGVLIGETDDGYWVVTNRHVVQTKPVLCVMGSDRRADPAVVLPPARDQRQADLDLAFLWLPRGTSAPRVVAQRAEATGLASELPLVVSTGYPVELETNRDGPLYKEQEGLLVPLLDSPLEGGYDLTFALAIGKGMSGGGVFLGTRLIGINGVHADPLWRATWRRADGGPLSAALNRKLELVSMGISVGTIEGLLRQTSRPSAEQIRSLAKHDCGTADQSPPSRRLVPAAKAPI